MTIEEFMDELKTIAPDYSWRFEKGYMIRGFQDNLCFCPLTALGHSKTNQYRTISDWNIVAEQLGLRFSIGHGIVFSADNRDGHLRYQLLKSVGLMED